MGPNSQRWVKFNPWVRSSPWPKISVELEWEWFTANTNRDCPIMDKRRLKVCFTMLCLQNIITRSLMPSSHLPRTPCDKMFYDFLCNFFCHRRWLRATAYVFTLSRGIVRFLLYGAYVFTLSRGIVRFLLYGASGVTRGKSVKRLCGDCTEIVQCQCSCRAVSAAYTASARKSYGARAGIGLRTVRGLCNATYEMSTGYGLTIFSNCQTSRETNHRGRGARESVRKSHSRILPPQGGLAEAARKGGYGQDTGSVDQSQAKCELGITC